MYFLEELSRRINKNPHRSPEEGDYYFERIGQLAPGENPQSCGPLAAWGLQWFIIQPEWVLDDN